MEREQHRPESLYRSTLPWWLGVGAFAWFVFTLSPWVSVLSLGPLVRVTGSDGMPLFQQPLSFLFTLPVRLVPAAWQPLALNLLAAAAAAVTLGLLARSVLLLPHDRTQAQRHGEPSEHSLLSVELAWLPPVLAAGAAGLQLTFWEHATSYSGEMLDLLVFAFCLWSLLEYRIDRQETRLFRMAFVYGLGVTNNVAMIAFLPLFVVATIWIRGRAFFHARTFFGLTACGAAGLLLYLLPPVMEWFGDTPHTFWTVLKANWSVQYKVLKDYPLRALVLLGLLAPVFCVAQVGIRWPSSFGETSQTGQKLSRALFHIAYGALLAVCLAIFFDPDFSPREHRIGWLHVPLYYLPFYFLGALAAGYFAGYFLVVFHPRARRRWERPSTLQRAAQALAVVAVVAAAAVPVALAYRNYGLIRLTNGPALREFATVKAAQLPPEGAVVLADDTINLRLVETILRAEKRADKFVLLETRWLPFEFYHRDTARLHPGRLPEPVPHPGAPGQYDSPALIQWLAAAARSNRVFYLHPSFGYYFEAFDLAPNGLVYELTLARTDEIVRPRLTDERREVNNRLWRQLRPRLEALSERPEAGNTTLIALRRSYALGANCWGVELQRHGDLVGAGEMFDLALRLFPDNASAGINRDFNRRLQQGATGPVELSASVRDRFGKFPTWDAVLSFNGPIDDPGISFQFGRELVRNFQYRQAAYQFARVAELNPPNLGTEARLARLGVLVNGQRADDALREIAVLRAEQRPLGVAHQIELIRLEAGAQFAKGDRESAEQTLQRARIQFPQDESVLDALSQMYLLSGRFEEARTTIDEQLRLAPDSERALLNRGAAAIQLKDYAGALPFLTRALELQPQNSAVRMNRGIALLQLGQLDAARQDFKEVLQSAPNQFAVHHRLAEIADQQKDLANALKHYETYLRFAPTNSDEAVKVRARVTELRGAKPAP